MSDDDDDVREEWLRHPFTLNRKEALKKEANLQQKVLFGACSKSTDAEVRGQYMRYLELESEALIFERGGKKK